MSLPDPIGGYFELELRKGARIHPNALALNSARSGFEYILRTLRPKKIYLPKYTCEVMLEPLQRVGIDYVFYSLNEKMELRDPLSIQDGDLLVYTNYFGLKDGYCGQLARDYGDKILIDCSQALYYKQQASEHVIYSPRKFVGVSDGGLVVSNARMEFELPHDISLFRFSHLLKRIEEGPESGYVDFQANDKNLSEMPMSYMSHLTHRILQSIDYDQVASQRRKNFYNLHKVLSQDNRLDIDFQSECVPMVYPFMIKDASGLRSKLIEAKVFTATYWPNVFRWCTEDEQEYSFARDILALPTDQRYNEPHMLRILEVISEYQN